MADTLRTVLAHTSDRIVNDPLVDAVVGWMLTAGILAAVVCVLLVFLCRLNDEVRRLRRDTGAADNATYISAYRVRRRTTN